MDITQEAREIVSCVRYLGERFGTTMVVDVLRGSKNERLLRQRLDRLPVYGKLQATREEHLREMVNTLLLQGYLEQSQGEYPVLSLGPQADRLLRGLEPVTMQVRQQEEAPKAKVPLRALPKGDPGLFHQLQQLRAELSRKQNVPMSVIFSNATLEAMAAYQPTTPAELLEIPGVGQAKLQRFGPAFLKAIQQWKQGRT